MDKKRDLLELQQVFADLPTDPPHRLVEATRKQLRNARADKNGILETQAKRCLDVRVSKARMERALTLLGALLTILEQRGFSIQIREEADSAKPITCLRLAGEEIQLHIEEGLDPTPHTLTAAEKKKLARKEALFGRYAMYPNEWHLHLGLQRFS